MTYLVGMILLIFLNIFYKCISQQIINLNFNESNFSLDCRDKYKFDIINITCINGGCSESNITCPSNNKTIINCVGINSTCNKLNIYSKDNYITKYDIDLNCIGTSSCIYLNIDINDNSIIHFNTICDNNSCFELLATLPNVQVINWNCYNYSCQYNSFYIPYGYLFDLNCFGDITSPIAISTCFQLEITTAKFKDIVNISCFGSYACGYLDIYPAQVNNVTLYSQGNNAMEYIKIYHPTEQSYINIICESIEKYSCSNVKIIGDSQLVLTNTKWTCIGRGCGNNFAINSKYGLNDINFTLDSKCLCSSPSDCIGGVQSIFGIDQIWNNIQCGSIKTCNYSMQILKEPDVNSYNELTCQIYDFHGLNCSSTSTPMCCGKFIEQITDSFNLYNDYYNCSIPSPHISDDDNWYYPVALSLSIFVIICLLLIWCKNLYRTKQNRGLYNNVKYKHGRYKHHYHESTNTITTNIN